MNKKEELTWIEWWRKEKLAKKERWKQNHPDEPEWLKYASPKYQEQHRKKLAERRLFEMRKQLFNGEKSKKSVEGGEKHEAGLRKRQTYDPNLPHPSLSRLITRCWNNIQDWRKEQDKEERLKFKKIEESMK